MKQFLSVFLCVVILLSGVVPVSANTNATAHYFDYELLKDGTISITGYNKDLDYDWSVMIIPRLIGGYTVSAISDGAFLRASDIETVVIKSSVKVIGESAFQESSVKHVFIQEGVETISDRAFLNCTQLETLVIPSSVTTIGEQAVGFAWYQDSENPDVLPGTPDVIPGFMLYADNNDAVTAYTEETGVALTALSQIPLGDIDFDGTASTKDVRTMLQYMTISDVMFCLADWPNADVNADGEFNTTDARILLTSVITQ